MTRVPQTALELVLNLSEHIGKAGIDHLSAKLRPLPQLPTLPQLPQLQAVPAALPGVAALAAPAVPPAAPAPEPEPSYAAEFGIDDTAVACWPCTQRHVNTALVAAEAGAADPTEAGQREAAATVLGEIDVWRRYDVTADKLQRTPAGKRAAVTAALPGMAAARGTLQPPPADLHLAWAAAGEAERFLRGNPTPLERSEAEERLQDVHGWVGRADTLPLPPAAAPHLRALRSARHGLNREGPTHAATLAMRDALRDAAVALTPDPGPAALAAAATHARSARAAFRRGALGALQARQPAPPPAAPRAYVDRDARLPEAMATAYLDEAPGAIQSALGATPATASAFARLAEFSAARGVPVRDEPLPAEYAIEDGHVVYTAAILGAYLPGEDVIYVGTQAPVAAPRDVEMLAEEVAHSLLDSPRCNRWRSPPGTDYDAMPEEREAKLASVLALLDAGVPIETSAGRAVDPARVRVRVDAIERAEDPRIVRRARWAAGVMAQALRGDVRGAAAASGACPLAG